LRSVIVSLQHELGTTFESMLPASEHVLARDGNDAECEIHARNSDGAGQWLTFAALVGITFHGDLVGRAIPIGSKPYLALVPSIILRGAVRRRGMFPIEVFAVEPVIAISLEWSTIAQCRV